MNQLKHRIRGHKACVENDKKEINITDNMPPIRIRRNGSLQRCSSKTNLMDNATKNHMKIMMHTRGKPPMPTTNRTVRKISSGNDDGTGNRARKTKVLKSSNETKVGYKVTESSLSTSNEEEENSAPPSLCSLHRSASSATNSSLSVEAGDFTINPQNAMKRQNKNFQKMFQKARKTNAPMVAAVVKENRFAENQVGTCFGYI